MKKLTTEQFIKRANKVHDNKYNYSLVEYKNTHNKIKIICLKHGIFEQTPNKHLKGQGCIECSGKKKLTKKEFIKRANKVHDNKYNHIHDKVIINCPIHGEFEQVANSHLNGNGCKMCGYINVSKKGRLLKNDFIKRVKKIHDNKYDYSLVKYLGIFYKVKIICPRHGTFEQTPDNHLQGKGCPKCTHIVSKPEKEIGSFLDYLKVNYKQSDRSIIKPYELDIVIPSKKLSIEFNGKYWHSNEKILERTNGKMNAQEYHQMKTDMCNEKGYKLLHIFEEDWIKDKQKELYRIKDFLK